MSKETRQTYYAHFNAARPTEFLFELTDFILLCFENLQTFP